MYYMLLTIDKLDGCNENKVYKYDYKLTELKKRFDSYGYYSIIQRHIDTVHVYKRRYGEHMFDITITDNKFVISGKVRTILDLKCVDNISDIADVCLAMLEFKL